MAASLSVWSVGSSWMFLWLILAVLVADGISEHCDKDRTSCEFYLDIDHWLPMRLGPNMKVYVNSTDGKIYKYNDDTGTEVNPDDVILADGSEHERVLALFNRTLPGPTLIVYKDQEVVVHVRNHMLSDGTSVHFHGIEMRGTPWMDGAAFVTQCPIMPGQSFTYRFTPNRSGTYYYHAHLGMQMSMGLVAPFIVKERNDDVTNEHVLVIQDYNNRFSGDDLAMAGALGLYYPGGKPLDFSPKEDGTITTVMEITSTLVNGRGRVYDANGVATTHTPLSVFNVASGTLFKFRVIHAGAYFQYKVSVDGHKLTINALDGNDIEPVLADYVILHSGERADFSISTNQDADNYWIRVESLQVSKGQPGYAILRYENAPEVEPTTSPKDCSETNPCIVANCPFPSTNTLTCINIEDLNNKNAEDPAPVPESPEKFKEFFLNVGLALDAGGNMYGHLDGVSLKLPSVSALTQPSESTRCNVANNCGPDQLCWCNRPLNVDFGDVVQITFVNMGFLAIVHHPMHIHGYSAHVVKVGYAELDQVSGRPMGNSDIECHTADISTSLCNNNTSWRNNQWSGANIPGVKINKAVRKDTVTVPANGYVIVRFKADNPGLWYIHCHLEWHNNAGGMGVLLNDSFSHIPPPPVGFPECRSFPPPTWLTESRQTTEATTTNPTSTISQSAVKSPDRTFTQEEFWGMVGALLFVILLQFVISVVCMRRQKSSSFIM